MNMTTWKMLNDWQFYTISVRVVIMFLFIGAWSLYLWLAKRENQEQK